MENLHLFKNGGTIISDGHVTFLILDLKKKKEDCITLGRLQNVGEHHEASLLTILSIPLGPRLVRTASATAAKPEGIVS